MVAAVRVHKNGGPEVLTYEEVEVPAPGPGQVRDQEPRLRPQLHRHLFPLRPLSVAGGLPFIAGNEGAGEVVAVGPA